MFINFVDPNVFPQLPPNAPEHFDDPTASPGTEHFIMAGQSNFADLSVADLTAVSGVSVFKQLAGQGIGSQAVALLYDWAMRLPRDGGLGLRRMWADVAPWNDRSQALHGRLGLKPEGITRAVNVTAEPVRGDHGQSPRTPELMAVLTSRRRAQGRPKVASQKPRQDRVCHHQRGLGDRRCEGDYGECLGWSQDSHSNDLTLHVAGEAALRPWHKRLAWETDGSRNLAYRLGADWPFGERNKKEVDWRWLEWMSDQSCDIPTVVPESVLNLGLFLDL